MVNGGLMMIMINVNDYDYDISWFKKTMVNNSHYNHELYSYL